MLPSAVASSGVCACTPGADMRASAATLQASTTNLKYATAGGGRVPVSSAGVLPPPGTFEGALAIQLRGPSSPPKSPLITALHRSRGFDALFAVRTHTIVFERRETLG